MGKTSGRKGIKITQKGINEAKKIGMRIREARIARKMSQADLSENAQISLPQISDIENGKSNMMLSSFIRITEALQVSADSLLRTDIPEVSHIYNAEFSELLSGCSPAEIDSIMRIVAELKATFHSHKAEYDS